MLNIGNPLLLLYMTWSGQLINIRCPPMKLFRLLALFFVLISLCSVASAGGGDDVDVGVRQAEIISLPPEITDVVSADGAVAKVERHGSRRASIIGKNIGKTCVNLMNGKKLVKKINVNVHPDIASIKKAFRSLLPLENIGVEMVNHTVALTGVVSDAESAARAVRIADEFLHGENQVLNLMQVRSGQQVMLRVKVGEMRRSDIQRLGLGVQGIISGGRGVFGALEGDGVFKTLAEPTLTAISGKSATFLAGGEFPVPVAQGNNTMSVDYKKFGVSLDFTPVVLSEKRIRMRVASEVSELSDAGSVKMNGAWIPGISTRRADTTIELAPGESFMIAGLIKNNTHADLNSVPGLGSVPILNLLFRSAEFRSNESELVIAVTPYMADPMEAKDVKLPVDGYAPASVMEMFMLGRLQKNKVSPNRNSGLEGPAGFVVD